MEETFKAITVWLASGTEAAAALIIGLAAIEGTIRALWLFVPSTAGHGEPKTMGTLSQHHILRQDARGVHEMAHPVSGLDLTGIAETRHFTDVGLMAATNFT